MAAVPVRGFVEIARARVAFITLLLAIFYYVFRQSLLKMLETAVDSIHTGIPGLSAIARAIRSAFDYVLHYIEAQIAAAALLVETPAVDFLHAITIVAGRGAYVAAHTAERTLHALDALRRVTIPALIGAAAHPLWRARHLLQVGLHSIVKAVSAVEAFVGKESKALEHDIAKALHAAGAALAGVGSIVIPRAIDFPARKAREAEATAEKVYRGLRKLNPALVTALGGLLVLTGIRSLRLSRLRCSKVNKLAKGVCRMEPGLLDSLLADLVIIGGAISFVKFTEECQGFFGVVEDGLQGFIRELHGLEG